MAGKFQPARLDVDPSILDNQLNIVGGNADEENDIFKSMTNTSQPKIETLLPEEEYPSLVVYPKPGLCLKTKNAKGTKFFVNLCRLNEIPAPTPISEQELERVIADEDYTTLWRVPMSIGEPRTVKDKAGGESLAADVAVNSTWFTETMEPSEIFTTFVFTVAMEGLGDKHPDQARLDREGWVILKNKKYMGADTPPHRIQKRASSGISQVQSAQPSKAQNKPQKAIEEVKVSNLTPQFKIEKDSILDPSELTASVHLPGVRNFKDLNLEIGGDRLLLESPKTRHLLDVFLPFPLDPQCATAAFNPENNVLRVSIPISAL